MEASIPPLEFEYATVFGHEDDPRRYRQSMSLNFIHGWVRGIGADPFGIFTIRGAYTDILIGWTLSYVGGDELHYVGRFYGEMMSGRWTWVNAAGVTTGKFVAWPVAQEHSLIPFERGYIRPPPEE